MHRSFPLFLSLIPALTGCVFAPDNGPSPPPAVPVTTVNIPREAPIAVATYRPPPVSEPIAIVEADDERPRYPKLQLDPPFKRAQGPRRLSCSYGIEGTELTFSAPILALLQAERLGLDESYVTLGCGASTQIR